MYLAGYFSRYVYAHDLIVPVMLWELVVLLLGAQAPPAMSPLGFGLPFSPEVPSDTVHGGSWLGRRDCQPWESFTV